MSETTAQSTTWDYLIRGAKVFDGTGKLPVREDIAVADGRIAARAPELDPSKARKVIDGTNQWAMPGLFDIHTHYDLELEVAPGLPESVRHGTTTVVIANCSLGLAFGSQRKNGADPIVDCYARVENIPKSVLKATADRVDWENPKEYMLHLNRLNLGPNLVTMVPHSMLRIEVMGFEASVSRDPTEDELVAMEGLLEKAMDDGYAGFSTDALPFHYLANQPNTRKTIPTQFAKFGEMKRLMKVLRKYDRVWQTTPIIEKRSKAFLFFLLTSGRLFGKTLKTSALSAIEFVLTPDAHKGLLGFAALMNSRLFKGHIHFQALGTNFRIWSDGIVSPLYEELDSTCELIAREYDDVEGRKALLNNPEFIRRFREDWHYGRRGRNFAHLKTKLGLPDNLVVRDLHLMIFDGAPVKEWDSESMQVVFDRLERFQRGAVDEARSDAERDAFEKFPSPIGDDAEFMLHMMREYDKSFRFWVDVGNAGNHATLDLLLYKHAMPGFNDSGAHITNMAFFDANLMSLKLAQAQSMDTVATMVKRLTREPAEFFGLDVGTLEIGAQADITMLDPEVLKTWDSNDNRIFEHRELFMHKQMLNRSDGVVDTVWIKGEPVWRGGTFTSALGSKPLGRALRAA